ncbi:hypothetical protein M3484_04640 [Pseudomonas sp. GX19020]|uniref:hypothetical protein n=1 Tax=Pseudomonas sp. GX19020 TaxID=2942277 RepID=UPI002018E5F8|nr:hypothetical protein [Pseudomonas sp. GX19020]MCL4065851.1 hypothetical protein [Pseudomonas sp. GX19020]
MTLTRSAMIAFSAALLSTAALAEGDDMRPWIGHVPSEPVEGMAFIDHPAVLAVLDQAVPDEGLRQQLRVLSRARESNASAVFEEGDKLYFHAGLAGFAAWGISVSVDGQDGAVCIARAVDGKPWPDGTWFVDGRAVSLSPGGCPTDAAGLRAAFAN